LLQIVIKEKISKFWFSLKTKIWFETWIIVGSRTDNHIDFLTISMHVGSDYRKFKRKGEKFENEGAKGKEEL
jgi:hypothetical protein